MGDFHLRLHHPDDFPASVQHQTSTPIFLWTSGVAGSPQYLLIVFFHIGAKYMVYDPSIATSPDTKLTHMSQLPLIFHLAYGRHCRNGSPEFQLRILPKKRTHTTDPVEAVSFSAMVSLSSVTAPKNRLLYYDLRREGRVGCKTANMLSF